MPAARTSSTSSSPVSKRAGAPKAKGAVRAKSGCYTCRIRRKKCDEQQDAQGHCSTCVRLRLECLGFGAKRPDWLRENRNVVALRDKIKQFLGAQGMIKGHSSAVPRSAESTAILRLNLGDLGDNADHPSAGYHSSSSSSPPTHTQPIPPNNAGSSGSSSGSNSGDEYPPVHRHHPTSGIRTQWATAVDPSPYGHDYYQRSQSPADSINLPYQTQIPPSPHSLALLPCYRYPQHHRQVQLQLQPHSQENDNAGTLFSPATKSGLSPSYNFNYSGTDFQDELLMSYSASAYPQQQQYCVDSTTYINHLSSGTLPEWMPGPTSRYEIPFASDLPSDALDHYIRHVVNVQYLLESPNVRNMIAQSVNSDERCREAVTLLASVHWMKNAKQTRTNVLEHGDLKTRLTHLEQLLNQAFKTSNFLGEITDAAMAALHLVSVVLFDGGKGAWKYYLAPATEYVHHRMAINPAGEIRLNRLKSMSEKEAFIVKTTIWFDVLASVTLGTPPALLDVVRNLFKPNQSGVVEVGGYPSPRSAPSRDTTPQMTSFGPEVAPSFDDLIESKTSMMSPMGCENRVVWAIAEISALAQWKDEQRAKGQLSYPELVARAQEIERELEICPAVSAAPSVKYARRCSYPYAAGGSVGVGVGVGGVGPSTYAGGRQTATGKAGSKSPRTLADFNNDAMKYSRYLTARIFRASATLYLHAVVSGGWPHVHEIQQSVEETLKWIKCIPLVKANMPSTATVTGVGGEIIDAKMAKQIAKTVIRSTVFSFYICGALAEKEEDFKLILEYLDQEGREMVGNISSIVALLEEVWKERDAAFSFGPAFGVGSGLHSSGMRNSINHPGAAMRSGKEKEVMWRDKLHPSPDADPILLV